MAQSKRSNCCKTCAIYFSDPERFPLVVPLDDKSAPCFISSASPLFPSKLSVLETPRSAPASQLSCTVGRKMDLQQQTSVEQETARQQRLRETFRRFGILCNNSVHGGDCYGETHCLCGLTDYGLQKFYNRRRKMTPILHNEYSCAKCQMIVCGCCYSDCPHCNGTIFASPQK